MYSTLLPIIMLFVPGQVPTLPVGTGPEPAPRPISWELEFRFLDPQRITVQLPDQAEPEVYWYVVYTAVNNSGHTQNFFPISEIVTDELVVLKTDMGISPLVFDAIRERHRVTHPDLVHPTKAIGPLRVGDDYARESVAIWRGVDLSANSFRLYVAGLSGETQFLPNPLFDPEQPETGPVLESGDEGVDKPSGNLRYFALRKTLEIDYTLPGSPGARAAVAPQRGPTRWIMR